jgi:hypothetical protein
MFDDDEAADALRAIAEAPEPPSTTTAHQVIRLGRRRLRARRAGTVAGLAAGVVTIVTGIVMGSSLLATPNGSDVAASPSVQPPPLELSDWTKIEAENEECDFDADPPSGADLPLPTKDGAESAVVDAVASATGSQYESLVREWHEPDANHPGSGRLTGVVPTEAGPALLDVFVSSFGGSAQDAGRLHLAAESCFPHYRTVLDDGTVMVMVLREGPKTTSADLDVYVGDGRRFAVQTLSGISTPTDETGERVEIDDAVDLPFQQIVEIGYELSQAGL